MRKRDRHQLIKKMITEEKLSTQKEIQDRLEAHNVCVTQTTLSRDLREIGLTKVKKNDMVYYVLVNETEINETEKIDLVEFLSHHLEGVARAEFTLVLHTKLGEASVLANIVDVNKDKWILGTVAGANTLLVICRDQHVAKLMEDRLLDLMKDK
ncbi:arginine repressor [Streptococcus pneumoniae]|uniref:arginine repressor n=1 Tax=Streptococcus pneumoniae TaxID=1313 RepID=UPI0005E77578|nr:arginine repressor [Streptococcus pneumoniae]CIS49623.1 arginine repressor [Streptococcus pneumoniae]CKD65361.1 arginine repressor [Streptococcus pneumoniae]